MRAASVHHTLSLWLLPPPGSDSSHISPPAWGPFHEMQIFMSFPIIGTPWAHKSSQQTCSSTNSSLPQCHRSSQGPPPACDSHIVTVSCQDHPSAAAWGLQVGLYFTTNLHGLQITAYLTMICTTGCRRISVSVPEAPLPHLSPLDFVFAELLLSHVLTPLFLVKIDILL